MSVRWDAVVKYGAVGIRKDPPPPPLSAQDCRAAVIQVHVQLFGALAAASPERSIRFELPAGAAIADVLAALGERFGEAFSERVLDLTGAKHRHCRLFVDGYPVEQLRAPLDARSGLTQVEIILLIAPEGG